MAKQIRLLQRLERVLKRWEKDATRKGSDLGEHLRKNYAAKLNQELNSGKMEVELLRHP